MQQKHKSQYLLAVLFSLFIKTSQSVVMNAGINVAAVGPK